MRAIIIGIAGGSGSGKTTLTRHLKEHFGENVTVIGHDSYYKRQEGKTYEERALQNYDHPEAFETDLLIRHLQELREGRSIHCPVYSYADHNRTDQTVEIFPAKVLIVEGILIFQDPALRELFDIKIFVETDADERILRRALRDVEERERTLRSVVTQYLTKSGSNLKVGLRCSEAKDNYWCIFDNFRLYFYGTMSKEIVSDIRPALNEKAENGGIFSTPADVYTLNGVCIRRQATSTDGLPKGIYIVKGYKIVVR